MRIQIEARADCSDAAQDFHVSHSLDFKLKLANLKVISAAKDEAVPLLSTYIAKKD